MTLRESYQCFFYTLFLFLVNSLPGVKLRTTHRMQEETFKEIVKLGAGAVKKKKGKGKKKKVVMLY